MGNTFEEKEVLGNHNVGISVGLGKASKLLMEDAVKYFRRGTKADMAEILREHAYQLELASAKAHSGPPE